MTDLREKVALAIRGVLIRPQRFNFSTYHGYGGYQALADAALAIARPAGFVLVPTEPTEEMLAMALKVDAEWYPLKNRVGRLQLIKAYRAMISATQSEP